MDGAKNIVKTGSQMVLDKGKDVGKDLVTKGRDLAISKGKELTQKVINNGLEATQKAIGKAQDLQTPKWNRLIARFPIISYKRKDQPVDLQSTG